MQQMSLPEDSVLPGSKWSKVGTKVESGVGCGGSGTTKKVEFSG